MIIQKVPPKAPLIIKSMEFTANYVSTGTRPGFDFSVDANKNLDLFDVATNSIYIWDSISIAANIPEEHYLQAISQMPLIYFKKGLNDSKINIVSLNKYSEKKEITSYVNSISSSEKVKISCDGLLKMTENLIGVSQIKIFVTCNVWQVSEKEYNINYFLPTEKSFSDSLRK